MDEEKPTWALSPADNIFDANSLTNTGERMIPLSHRENKKIAEKEKKSVLEEADAEAWTSSASDITSCS